MYWLLLACVRAGALVSAPPAFTVYANDDAVLAVTVGPGSLTSTAPPPPGGWVQTHPFVGAAALDAGYESQLRDILLASANADDFVVRLQAAGFRVVAR